MERSIERKIIRQIKARRVKDNYIVRIKLWTSNESNIPETIVIRPQFSGGLKLQKLSCDSVPSCMFKSYKIVEYQMVVKKEENVTYV